MWVEWNDQIQRKDRDTRKLKRKELNSVLNNFTPILKVQLVQLGYIEIYSLKSEGTLYTYRGPNEPQEI